jgi:hypothetical protein
MFVLAELFGWIFYFWGNLGQHKAIVCLNFFLQLVTGNTSPRRADRISVAISYVMIHFRLFHGYICLRFSKSVCRLSLNESFVNAERPVYKASEGSWVQYRSVPWGLVVYSVALWHFTCRSSALTSFSFHKCSVYRACDNSHFGSCWMMLQYSPDTVLLIW